VNVADRFGIDGDLVPQFSQDDERYCREDPEHGHGDHLRDASVWPFVDEGQRSASSEED
jgi:hypothetical protein